MSDTRKPKSTSKSKPKKETKTKSTETKSAAEVSQETPVTLPEPASLPSAPETAPLVEEPVLDLPPPEAEPDEPMPDASEFGGSGIVKECYQWIHKHVRKGSVILELGSGSVSTRLLGRLYRLISVEHDRAWIDRHTAEYVHADLVDGWYDPAPIAQKLEEMRERGDVCRLILVDGPPGSESRAGFLKHIEMFDTNNAFIIIDNTDRPIEWEMAREIERRVKRPLFRFKNFSVV